MSDCKNHAHSHGPSCGHQGIIHEGHVDYLHDGHLHHMKGASVEEHKIAVNQENPDSCTSGHNCQSHDSGTWLMGIYIIRITDIATTMAKYSLLKGGLFFTASCHQAGGCFCSSACIAFLEIVRQISLNGRWFMCVCLNGF